MAQWGTMQQLEFVELDEDGRLVVAADDGTRFVVPVDDRVRAALRPRRQSEGEGDGPASSATPREVQAMIRAGQTAEEVADGTGWELARVQRFEGPVLAEREHVVGLAKAAHVRAQGRTDGSHTLERRVRERLQSRGVTPADTGWDAARSDNQAPWTVLVVFRAGGKERRATWHYDVHDRSIEALDDEARWLSEDEQALPGGLAGHPLLGSSHAEDETADLMATMRERRQSRGRRTRRPDVAHDEAPRPVEVGPDDEVLPLENLPEMTTVGEPPAAHPRGSAPESPSPVGPADDAAEAESSSGSAPDDHAAGAPRPEPRARTRQGRTKKDRRRLRMPKLPPAVGEPVPEDEPAEPEGTYARTRDPQEVSFEEFFGPEDDPLDVEGAAVDEDDQDTDGAADEIEVTEEAAPVPAPVADDADAVVDDPDAVVDDPDAIVDDPDAVVDEGPEADGAADAQDSAEDDGRDDLADAAASEGEDAPPAAAEAPEPSDDEATSTKDASAARRKGRTSVPSWDDIMFGGGDRRRR